MIVNQVAIIGGTGMETLPAECQFAPSPLKYMMATDGVGLNSVVVWFCLVTIFTMSSSPTARAQGVPPAARAGDADPSPHRP